MLWAYHRSPCILAQPRRGSSGTTFRNLKQGRTDADSSVEVVLSRGKDALAGQLVVAQRRLTELEAELARTRTHDPLVESLLTLRAFRTQLELDVKRAERYRRPLSVAVLDVDRFGRINAEQGFAAGDQVLSAVGRLVAESTRVNDLACRVGADEFAVMLPETPGPGGVQAVERLLVRLERLEAAGTRGLAASVGVAELCPGHTGEQLLAAARSALELARAEGGGRVALHDPEFGLAVSDADDEESDVAAVLSSALQERDRYTGDHSESVVELTAKVAEALGLSAEEVGRVRTAALLHDIGKLGVPDEILHKPGPLDEREWEVMRQHPLIGERILRAIPGLGVIARIVRHEHERWDGRGYPDGVGGEEIPIGARIILACDAYHAMVSDRPYRRAMPHANAVAELAANAGTQFDPDVVETLVGVLYGRRQAGLTSV